MSGSSRFFVAVAVGAMILCATMTCRQRPAGEITDEEAEALVEGFLRFRNEGDVAAADAVLHPDCVIRYPDLVRDIKGLDAFKEYDRIIRAAFPDFEMGIHEFFVKGDRIVSYWTMTGTNKGPFPGPTGMLPPTNKRVRFSGVAISRVVDGKIVEDVAYTDMLGMLRQLGFQIVAPQTQSKE